MPDAARSAKRSFFRFQLQLSHRYVLGARRRPEGRRKVMRQFPNLLTLTMGALA